MAEIKALFKFSKIEGNPLVIDTTASSGDFRGLSPFILSAPPAKRFENLWQFSKVYKQHLDPNGQPLPEWFDWQNEGFSDTRAHRYPMGKGTIPEYSFWNGEKLGYIEARKQIYVPEYAKNVVKTDSYKRLKELCHTKSNSIILLDYDAYDHKTLGMTLLDVINNPKRKMGHAFVLLMMLENCLEECLGT